MAILFITKSFILWSCVAGGLAIIVYAIKPVQRFACWILLLGLVFAAVNTRMRLGQWIEDKYAAVQNRPQSKTDFFYLVREFIPAYRMIGGRVRPEIIDYVREKARQETDPCAVVWILESLRDPVPAERRARCEQFKAKGAR